MAVVHVMGNLGADPEKRFTPSGKQVWNLRVAERTYKNGQEETVWWNFTVWGSDFDGMLAHFKKGKPIYIVGDMNKLRLYTSNKTGQQEISYEATVRSLHFIPGADRPETAAGQQPPQQPSSAQEEKSDSYAAASGFEGGEGDDDTIPF